MITTNFQTMLVIIQNSGYILILLLMIIEGPLATTVAAFAASFGYFDIWIIFLLSIFGNLIPDLAFFFIGKKTRNSLIEKYLGYFKLNKKRIGILEKAMKNHAAKTIVLSKLTPFLPIAGIILAGFSKVSFKKFFKIIITYNLIFSIFFIALGFYSGIALNNFSKYLKLGQYSVLLAIFFIILIYLIYKVIIMQIRKI